MQYNEDARRREIRKGEHRNMDYEKLIATLSRKGYHGYFCKDSAAAKKLVM